MADIIYRKESYDIVGCLYEVFNCLGNGLSEIVYKDALKYEFTHIILKHKFYADFVVYNKIILEIKTVEILTDRHLGQCINYLKVSSNKLAILANFKGEGLEYKRVVL